jgi:hypothetical protein
MYDPVEEEERETCVRLYPVSPFIAYIADECV